MIVLTERRVPAEAASISELRHFVVAAILERAYRSRGSRAGGLRSGHQCGGSRLCRRRRG